MEYAAAGAKDDAAVSDAINKINNNARRELKLSDGLLIEGKKGSGYRINPKYTIERRRR